MRGQFLVISAVVIGIIMLGVAGLLSEVQQEQTEPSGISYHLEDIRYSVDRLDVEQESDREKLEHIIEQNDYGYELDYWEEEECVNITVSTDSGSYSMNCLPDEIELVANLVTEYLDNDDFSKGNFNGTTVDGDSHPEDLRLGYLDGKVEDEDVLTSSGWWTAGNSPSMHVSRMETNVNGGEESWTNITVNTSNQGFGEWDVNVSLWNLPKTTVPDIEELDSISEDSTEDKRGLAVGDVTGNSVPEILTVRQTSSDSVALYEYSGGFLNKIDEAGDSWREAASIGDMTSDGQTELIAAGSEFDLFELDGGDLTRLGSELGVPGTRRALTLADLTGDGGLEAIGIDTDDPNGNMMTAVRWDQGSGDLEIVDETTYDTSTISPGRYVGAADITQDGTPEIWAVHQSKGYLFEFDQVSGEFEMLDEWGRDSNGRGGGIGDITGDGEPDLVMSGSSGDDAEINLLGWDDSQQELFSHDRVELDTVQREMTVADISRNGRMDMIMDEGEDMGLWIWNQNRGELERGKILESETQVRRHGLAVTDVERDGKLEVIEVTAEADLRVYEQKGLSSEFLGSEELTFNNANGEGTYANISWVPEDASYNLVAVADRARGFTSVFGTTDSSSAPSSRLVQNVGSDLIGYWRMDEDHGGDSNGDTVEDFSGGQNDGETGGGIETNVEGVFESTGYRFDGSSPQYVDLGNKINFNDDTMALSTWVYPVPDEEDRTDSRIIAKSEGYLTEEAYYVLRKNQKDELGLTFRLRTGGNVESFGPSGNVLDEEAWNHVAVSYDGSQVEIYVNGEEESSEPNTGLIDADITEPTYIGDDPNADRAFGGRIDEFKLFDSSLTEAEVRELYLYGDTPFQGEFETETAGLADGFSPDKLELDSSVPENTEAEVEVRHLASGETETVQLDSTSSPENYTLTDIDATGGQVEMEAKLESEEETESPIIRGIRLWSSND